MNSKKISFIVCKKNNEKFTELIASISEVKIPESMEVDVLEVSGENGTASAYNEGMQASDSKYKIYIDENVKILDDNILYHILDTFDSHTQIGMIGVLGTLSIPTSGISLLAKKQIGKVCTGDDEIDESATGQKADGEVLAVQGFFMATQVDIPWRADLFTGECFYDTAQCIEMRRRGYSVFVPDQKKCWVRYEFPEIDYNTESQQKFIEEYSKDIFPLVTILIPTYNRPQLLKIALESVLNQTYRNLDIVISDNGKSDDTARMMKETFHDERILYVHQPDIDEMGNWKWLRAYDNPRAEYLNWLMDDDVFARTKIAEMIDCFQEEDNISLVTSYRKAIDIEGNILPDMKENQPVCEQTSRIDGESAGRELFLRMANFIGEPTTVLIKKECLQKGNWGFSGNEGRYHIGDYTLWLQLLSKGDMIYISKPLSYFRIHEGQESANVNVQIQSTLCWAIAIQHAWKHRLYIKDESCLRSIICQWLILAVSVVARADQTGIKSDMYMKALYTMQSMTQALTNGYCLEYQINDDPDTAHLFAD